MVLARCNALLDDRDYVTQQDVDKVAQLAAEYLGMKE